jgi:hypothetical protein
LQIGETLRNQTLRMFHGEATEARPGEPLGLTLAVQRFSENTPAHGCRLVWSFLDPNGPTSVSDKNLVDQTARDVDGDRTGCHAAAKIWVPLKPSLAKYEKVMVRVELFKGDARLGLPADSEVITLG